MGISSTKTCLTVPVFLEPIHGLHSPYWVVAVNLEAVLQSAPRAWLAWASEVPVKASRNEIPSLVSSQGNSHPGFSRSVDWPTLFKYGLAKKDCVRPTSLSGALPRKVGGKELESKKSGSSIWEAAFLSPDYFDAGACASKLLAVSYQPRYRMEVCGGMRVHRRFSGRDCGCCGELLDACNVFGEADAFNRVWPAFGKPGGGLETLLTEGASLRPLGARLRDSLGGPRMEGVQFEPWSNQGSVLDGVQAAVSEFNDLPRFPQFSVFGRDSDEEPPVGRVKFSEGVVATLSRPDYGLSVSLTKETASNGGLNLRLHSAIWFDAVPLRFVSWLNPVLIDVAGLGADAVSTRVANASVTSFAALRKLAWSGGPLQWEVSPLGPTAVSP